MISLPHYSKFDKDLWQYLASANKPVVMYGMGNGADKIIAVLDSYGVEIADFFASDGFVRGQAFHGKVVLSFADIKAKYKDFIILVSFGSALPEVLNNIYRLADCYELYAPDVPVSGETLFTLDFYKENYEKFKKAFDYLCDDISKETFCDMINYKLTGNISHLRRTISSPHCEKQLLDFDKFESFIDAGAYNGDTAKKFISDCKNAKEIIALEPDRRNFKKLFLYAEGESRVKITPVHCGAWDRCETLEFSVCGNRNSAAGTQNRKKTEPVQMLTIDSLKFEPDYIKYDVEGAEEKAIMGSRETLLKSSPSLLISAYHRSDDLFVLPLLIKELFSDYDLYLRRFEYVPAWDINLYAIKRS